MATFITVSGRQTTLMVMDTTSTPTKGRLEDNLITTRNMVSGLMSGKTVVSMKVGGPKGNSTDMEPTLKVMVLSSTVFGTTESCRNGLKAKSKSKLFRNSSNLMAGKKL